MSQNNNGGGLQMLIYLDFGTSYQSYAEKKQGHTVMSAFAISKCIFGTNCISFESYKFETSVLVSALHGICRIDFFFNITVFWIINFTIKIGELQNH